MEEVEKGGSGMTGKDGRGRMLARSINPGQHESAGLSGDSHSRNSAYHRFCLRQFPTRHKPAGQGCHPSRPMFSPTAAILAD